MLRVDSSRNEENTTKSDIDRGSADKESLIVEEEEEVDTTAQQQAQLNQFIKVCTMYIQFYIINETFLIEIKRFINIIRC